MMIYSFVILALLNPQVYILRNADTEEILWVVDEEYYPDQNYNKNPFFDMETLDLIAEWTPQGQALCEDDLNHNEFGEVINSRWDDSARIYECVENDSFEKVYTYPCPDVYHPNTYHTSLKAVGDGDSDNKDELIFTSGTSGVPREIVFVEARDSLSYPDSIVLRLREDSIGVNHMKMDDLDNDGNMECIGTTQGTHILVLAIWENVSDDSFQMVWSTKFGQSYQTSGEFSRGCDFDGDGFSEIAVTVSSAPSHVYVVENKGNDQYAVTWDQPFPSDNGFWAAEGPDLDNDGKKDFVVLGARGAAPSTWTCIMYEFVQDDSFAPVWRYDVNSGWIHGGVATGDIDGDGQNELLMQVQGGSYLFKGVADDSLDLVWQDNLPVSGQGEHRMITHDLDDDQKGEVVFYTSQSPARTVVFEKRGQVMVEEEVFLTSVCPLNVYPNPFSHKVNFEYSGNLTVYPEFEVFDVQGRMVEKIRLRKRLSQIDMGHLAAGVYFVRLKTEGISSVSRLVKIR